MHLSKDLQPVLLQLAQADAASSQPRVRAEEQELQKLIDERKRLTDASAAAQLAVDDMELEILRIQEDERKLKKRELDDKRQLSAETDPERRKDLEHDRYAAKSRIADLLSELKEAHNEIAALRNNRDVHAARVDEANRKVEAAQRAGRRLRLAGPISDTRYFEQQIAPSLGGLVHYEGHLHQHDLARLVGSCGATLVTPVWDEPYGLVVAESLACGTPVACFARGGIPEIVGEHAGVLVPPGDIDALALAVDDALTLDRGLVRRRAEDHCSDIAMIDRYLDIYADLVAGRPLADSSIPREVGV